MTAIDIEGWRALDFIYDEWIASHPRHGAVIVEVGVGIGRSIAYAAEALKDRPDIEIWAVDPWAGHARNGQQQRMADAAGGDFTLYARTMLEHAPAAFERVRVVRVPSLRAERMFLPDSVDLIVIDGDHSYTAVTNDIAVWRPKLRPDGWLAGDDHEPGSDVEWACRDLLGVGYEVRPPPPGAVWSTTWVKRP